MSRKPRIEDAKNTSNPAEAAVLGRISGGEVAVGAVVEGLTSRGFKLDESVLALQSLQRDKRVSVKEAKPYASLGSYALSPLSIWFWTALAAVAASLALITVTSGAALYLRYVFGSILVLFLPGYALIEALYPKGELEELVRFALSIGLSLALVPLTGLALNYTPWAIRLIPVAIALAVLTSSLLLLALRRRHGYYLLSRGAP